MSEKPTPKFKVGDVVDEPAEPEVPESGSWGSALAVHAKKIEAKHKAQQGQIERLEGEVAYLEDELAGVRESVRRLLETRTEHQCHMGYPIRIVVDLDALKSLALSVEETIDG